MLQRADESAEDDLLLSFPTEPGGKPPESPESIATRVERLEGALNRSEKQIDSLKAEVATLVGTVADIGKSGRRRITWPSWSWPVFPAQTRLLTATAGIVVFALALGALGWALWSRDPIDTIDTIDTAVALEAAAEELPVVQSASPLQPVSLVAAPTPEPVTEPERIIPAQRPVRAAVNYVGTLSIDAAPGGEVFIDRKAAGRTPLRVQNLKAGSHLVWIQRDGYRRFTRVVQVPADRVSRVWADLEPIPER